MALSEAKPMLHKRFAAETPHYASDANQPATAWVSQAQPILRRSYEVSAFGNAARSWLGHTPNFAR